MPDSRKVRLEAERDAVSVYSAAELNQDRSIRLFFSAVLGGTRTSNGWRCPRRSLSLHTLIVRINTFFESRGIQVERTGMVDDAVQQEIERKRSFERARHAGVSIRHGNNPIDLGVVKAQLRDFGWNETERSLFPHQEIGLIHGLASANAANFSVPGAGKTVTSLAVAATHMASGNIDLAVVVGPLSCFGPWEKECRAALNPKVTTIRVRGAADARQVIYDRAASRQILLMSYATAAADKAELIELCRRLRVMLIVDESHRIKRFRGGLWAPSLMEIAKFARIKLVLSGTPMPQSGRDLYSQLRILWPGGELTGPQDDFSLRVDRNFNSVLHDVRPFVSRTPKRALGLDPYSVIYHEASLGGTQEEIYDLIEGQFRRTIQDAETWRDKLAALKRGRPIRLLQATANPDLLNKVDGYYGVASFEGPNPTLLQRLAAYGSTETPAKSLVALDVIRDIVDRKKQTGGKVVCWSNFVHNLDQFSELVRTRLGIPVMQIDGRVPTGDQPSDDTALRPLVPATDTREAIIDQFLSTNGPAVLVTNPASTSESISLHSSCHNAIYLDRTYDCALFLQSIDRIHRLGLKPGQQVEVHIILAQRSNRNRTADHLVQQSLSAKEAQMRQLLEGADLLPLNEPESAIESAEGDLADLNNLLRFLLGEDVQDGPPL
jgi:SNF2 family DNA or RNA helicase